MIGPSRIWTVSASASKTPRFPVVGYDKHLAVIRRNMESPIGWPYYHKSVMGDGSLTDLRGRVSALDIQDNLETNEKKENRSFEMIRYWPWFLFSKATSGPKVFILLHTYEKQTKMLIIWRVSPECKFAKNTTILDQQNILSSTKITSYILFLLKQYIVSIRLRSKRCLSDVHTCIF